MYPTKTKGVPTVPDAMLNWLEFGETIIFFLASQHTIGRYFGESINMHINGIFFIFFRAKVANWFR